jgi:hypothetical protein
MRFLRVLTFILLALPIIGGGAGGLAFLLDRSGGMLGMSVEQLPSWLRLDDYMVPGAVLIGLFGLLPLVAVVLLARRSTRGWPVTVAVGLLLILWSVLQLVVLGLPYAAVAAGSLIVGILLTGLGVDGGAVARMTDEWSPAVESYEHADDES